MNRSLRLLPIRILGSVFLWVGAIRADVITAELTLNSQPGDFIGMGQSFDFHYTNPPDLVSALAFAPSLTDPPSDIVIELLLRDSNGVPISPFAILSFESTPSHFLTVGNYPDAQAAPDDTHPGLSVGFAGRGCDSRGSFTINEIGSTHDPFGALVLTSFDVSFTQFCNADSIGPPFTTTAALTGRFTLSSGPPSSTVPEPSSSALFGSSLLSLAVASRRLRS